MSDSTAPTFFEGTEKKIELVVASTTPSLRARGTAYWHGIVEACGARVLSHVANDRQDAYLLSESSLFVHDHRVVMITCGRTRLTSAAEAMFEGLDLDDVRFFAYERKNEIFPHHQPTSFVEDAEALGRLMPGRAFQFAEHGEHHLGVFHLDRPYDASANHPTLQVLMHGLTPDVLDTFGPANAGRPGGVAAALGLDAVLDDAQFDEHLFEPQGYSLNAIRGAEYATVHVTPDHGGSYASFETNQCWRGDTGLEPTVQRLLSIFRPATFDLVLWEHGRTTDLPCQGYRVRAHVERRLSCGFYVQFVHLYNPECVRREAQELDIDRSTALPDRGN